MSIALTRRNAAFAKGTLGLALFLAAWQASVPLVGLEPYFYPSPRDVIAAFGTITAGFPPLLSQGHITHSWRRPRSLTPLCRPSNNPKNGNRDSQKWGFDYLSST